MLLDVGENHVELLAPLGEDTPVGRFLAKRGPGLHHVAYQVADIDAALASLRESGMRMIDSERHDAEAQHYTRVRPIPRGSIDLAFGFARARRAGC